ncbi:MAG: tRNA-binding protein [Dehalogenimonas sp.]|uniref:tRNA-binding protein n=1 Tax=Candidatus Dehalogenimonas loeffleri TaxID=3127115 RepID=A0ABZ2J284_9CHLR|nr:tRNA-binding protein [Dehalogenimonas sp.]
MITYDDFTKIEIRTGRVIKAEPFPKARQAAYKLWLDFGDLGIRQSSAQLTRRYQPAELEGRTLLAVTNLPPRQVADFVSEVLVLGAVPEEGDVVLIAPDAVTPPGTRIL